MTYRAALTYHPAIGTFRGNRGAWRVHHCSPASAPLAPRVWPVELEAGEPPVPMLYIDSPRPLATGTFVNPTRLLQ